MGDARSAHRADVDAPWLRRPSGGVEPGTACWGILGPDVELRRTPFSVEKAAARYRASGDPAAERMIDMLESPPSVAEIVEYAEQRVFAG